MKLARLLYALTVGALLNYVYSFVPSAIDRALSGLAKAAALLERAEALAERRRTAAIALQDDLYNQIDDLFDVEEAALAAKQRAARVRGRISELLA